MARRQPALLAALLLTLSLVGPDFGRLACAHNPKSPEVRALVDRALAYLESCKDEQGSGAACVIGLAQIKDDRKGSVWIERAAKHARLTIAAKMENYSLSCALLFLCERNRPEDMPLAAEAVGELLRRQKPHGGWGYPEKPTGDTSQTQLVMMALWQADASGIKVQPAVMANALNWLMRTQDPSGGFGYQGNDPGTMDRVNQSVEVFPVSHSLTAAGLGSMGIAADLLHFGVGGVKVAPKRDERLGNAANVAAEEKNNGLPPGSREPLTTDVDGGLLAQRIEEAARWLETKPGAYESAEWNCYHLYGLERGMSFREVFVGKAVAEPAWYNQGVEFLKKNQHSTGYFPAIHGRSYTPEVSTAMGVLFLIRGTRKAIAKIRVFEDDKALSGRLPANLDEVTIQRGKIVDAREAELQSVVDLLDDPDNPEFAKMLEFDSGTVALDPDDTKRASQIEKLRALVQAENYNARMVAVRQLGRLRQMDSVPVLLYAMTDPDLRVVAEADQALRFISRKIDGVGMPETPTESEARLAREAWRDWYLGIRPDAQFIE